LRGGWKGSYIGMFEFTCDVVTIPIRIIARSHPGCGGSAGPTCSRLALQHAESTLSGTETGRRVVTRAIWCAAPAGGGSAGILGTWA
jgi:hypothetical protein